MANTRSKSTSGSCLEELEKIVLVWKDKILSLPTIQEYLKETKSSITELCSMVRVLHYSKSSSTSSTSPSTIMPLQIDATDVDLLMIISLTN